MSPEFDFWYWNSYFCAIQLPWGAPDLIPNIYKYTGGLFVVVEEAGVIKLVTYLQLVLRLMKHVIFGLSSVYDFIKRGQELSVCKLWLASSACQFNLSRQGNHSNLTCQNSDSTSFV